MATVSSWARAMGARVDAAAELPLLGSDGWVQSTAWAHTVLQSGQTENKNIAWVWVWVLFYLGFLGESHCSPSLETLGLAGGWLLVTARHMKELRSWLSKQTYYLEFEDPKWRLPKADNPPAFSGALPRSQPADQQHYPSPCWLPFAKGSHRGLDKTTPAKKLLAVAWGAASCTVHRCQQEWLHDLDQAVLASRGRVACSGPQVPSTSGLAGGCKVSCY